MRDIPEEVHGHKFGIIPDVHLAGDELAAVGVGAGDHEVATERRG